MKPSERVREILVADYKRLKAKNMPEPHGWAWAILRYLDEREDAEWQKKCDSLERKLNQFPII